MPDTRTTASELGEVVRTSRCQICGRQGPVVAVPDAPVPNEFCAACAIEYGNELVAPESDAF